MLKIDLSESKAPRSGVIPAAALFLSLVLVVLSFVVGGWNHARLSDYTDFGSFFSPTGALLSLSLAGIFVVHCWALGAYVARRMGLEAPGSVAAGAGVVAFNLVFLVLGFARLLYAPVLLVVFAAVALLVRRELAGLCQALRRLILGRRRAAFWGVLFVVPVGLHLMNAVLPVTFSESFGDVGRYYLPVPMAFAHAHGASFDPGAVGNLARFLNYEALSAPLVVLSNPATVKLLGLALFLIVAWMLHDVADRVLRAPHPVLVSLLFLTVPVFAFDVYFSFAHPRTYVIFLSALALSLLLLAARTGEPKVDGLNLIVMGVLAGTDYAGILSAAIILLILVLLRGRAIIRSRMSVVCGLILLLLAAVWPVWNQAHTGAFFPAQPAISRLLRQQLDSRFDAEYARERMSLQFREPDRSPLDVVSFPVRFVFEHYHFLVVFFVLGLLFLRDRVVRILYAYSLSTMLAYAVLFPNSIRGTLYARFQWAALPAVVLSIAYVLSLAAARFRPAGDGPGISARVAQLGLRFAPPAVMIVATLFFTVRSVRIQSVSAIGDHLMHRVSFITGKMDLASFLGRQATITQYLNGQVSPSDSILYLFFPQGMYSRPTLQEAVLSGVGQANLLYRSTDKGEIMDRLRSMGIDYLCVDNESGIDPADPARAMVADITSPLFEPEFFARHFVPLKTGIQDLYLFKVTYEAITGGDAVQANFRDVDRTGFFHLMYESLTANPEQVVSLPANPYSSDVLRGEYERVKRDFAFWNGFPGCDFDRIEPAGNSSNGVGLPPAGAFWTEPDESQPNGGRALAIPPGFRMVFTCRVPQMSPSVLSFQLSLPADAGRDMTAEVVVPLGRAAQRHTTLMHPGDTAGRLWIDTSHWQGQEIELSLEARAADAPPGKSPTVTWSSLGLARRIAFRHPMSPRPRFGAALELLGYNLEREHEEGGDRFWVTLYWKAAARPQADYSAFARILDREGNVCDRQDQRPYGGAIPTNAWSPETIGFTSHELAIDSTCAERPTLQVGWNDVETGQPLTIDSGELEPLTSLNLPTQ